MCKTDEYNGLYLLQLADGTWMYEDYVLIPNLTIGIFLADKGWAEIEHLQISSTVNTLGSMACPTGSTTVALG
jgi:hypothetical protein